MLKNKELIELRLIKDRVRYLEWKARLPHLQSGHPELDAMFADLCTAERLIEKLAQIGSSPEVAAPSEPKSQDALAARYLS